MSWRDDLITASWRGVEFCVQSTTWSVGRRTVVHEFPAQKLPQVEDLGLGTRRVSVQGYVIGDEYLGRRDALRAALERPGAGTLVLPTWGTMQMVLSEPASLSESEAEGGLAHFSATFVQAVDDLRTLGEVDQSATAAEAIAAAMDALPEAHAAEQDVAAVAYADAIGQPTALEAAQAPAVPAETPILTLDSKVQASVLDRAQSALRSATSAAYSAVSKISAPAEAIRNIRSQIADIQAQAAMLAALPDVAAEMVITVAAEAAALAADVTSATVQALEPAMQLVAFVRAALDGAPESPPIQAPIAPPVRTPEEALEAALEAANDRVVSAAILLASADQATLIDYRTADSAQELASALSDLATVVVDPVAASEQSNAVRTRISVAASMTAQYLRDVAADLPRLTDHTPTTSMPALLLAHRLYGDASRARDIEALNALSDPLIVPGGQLLRVIADE